MISIKKSYLFVLAAIIGFGVHATNYNVQQSQSSQQPMQQASSLQKQTIYQQPSLPSKNNTPLNKVSSGRRIAVIFINGIFIAIYFVIGLFICGFFAGILKHLHEALASLAVTIGFIGILIFAFTFNTGYRIFGLEVVDPSGKPVSRSRRMGHTLLENLLNIIVWGGTFTKDGRFFNDQILDVYVIKKSTDLKVEETRSLLFQQATV